MEPNHTLDERRLARDQEVRIAEQMAMIISLWRPLIQFNAAILRAYAEGIEAIAINLDKFDGVPKAK